MANPDSVSSAHERLQSADRRQAIQYAVTRALTEATTVATAAGAVLHALGEGFGWQFGAFWGVERSADVLCCNAVWSAPGSKPTEIAAVTWRTTFARGEGLPGMVWATGQLRWVEEVTLDEALARRTLLAEQGWVQGVALPIQGAQDALGVIEFFAPVLERPNDELRSFLTALGSQIGQFVERIHFEGALRASEAFYHSLVETLPQNIIRKDRQGRFTFVNQNICTMLGLPRDQIVGKTDFDLFPSHLAEKYRQDDLRVLESGQPLETVEENQRPDGTTMYVQIIKTPIADNQGQWVGTQVVFWDVT
jgi:PAS domain S-box-containing protein